MKVEWVRVGDVLELDRTPADPDPDGVYMHIGVRGFGRGLFSYPSTLGSELPKLRFFHLAPDRLVVSNIKAWEGAVARTNADERGRIASNRFLTYRVADPCRADLDYLAHWFLSEEGISALGNASPGSADRNRTLSRTGFDAIWAPLPALLSDQRRIAAHLDSLVGLRSGVSRTGTDVLVNGLLDRFAWNSTLGDLLQPSDSEIEVDRAGTYRAMGVYGGGRGAIDRGFLSGDQTSYRFMNQVRSGQVVFSRLKAFEGAVTTVPDALDGAVVSKEFPVCTIRGEVDHAFVEALLRAPRTHAAMAHRSLGLGARRERLSLQEFLTVPAPSPSSRHQEQIGVVQSLRQRAHSLAETTVALSSALLPAARNEIFSAMR